MNPFGINLSFAIKRWPEPERWCFVVRDVLGLDVVQFTFDLLDPSWPNAIPLARRVKSAADSNSVSIHSVSLGLSRYTGNGLLHPDREVRELTLEWWRRATGIAAELGARALGGPLGALSVSDAANPGVREQRYSELVSSIREIAAAADLQGLSAVLIEPTPCPREIPATIDDCTRLVADLADAAVPVEFVIDVGHAVFRPLYGADVSLAGWLSALAPHVGVFHLQNTDYERDAHWGWPHEAGQVDVTETLRTLSSTVGTDVPIFLEMFHPFEVGDEMVLADVRATVAHCVESLPVTSNSVSAY